MIWRRFIRIFGLLLIISFSVISMFISFYVREMSGNPALKQALSYSSLFEDQFYDFRMRKTLDQDLMVDKIILGNIDDSSLQTIGRWPWPRKTWSDVLRKFKVFGAKVVAFDAMFPEPELVCGSAQGDKMFSEAIADFQSIPGNKVILAYTADDFKGEQSFDEMPGELFNFILQSKTVEGISLTPFYVSKQTYPIEQLLTAEPALGYISNKTDHEGMFRYYPLVNNFEELYLPSLALISFTAHTGREVEVDLQNQASYLFKIDGKTINLNTIGETKIRWQANQYNFPDVPIDKLIAADDNDPKMKKLLEGSLVFIGSTSTGAHDMRNTPISNNLPGVYAHMNVVNMLNKGFFYKTADESTIYSIIFLSIGVLLLLITQYFSYPILDILVTAGIGYAAFWADINYFLPNGYEIRLFFVFFSYFSIYSWNTFLNFTQSNKEKKQIKGTFSRYVAPSIVDEMLDNPEKLKVGGDKRDITCLFSDVRDFTSISEKLTPQELSFALNKYMGAMTDIVFETSGTLDKYIGDAIVAFWGAPLDVEDHPQKAVEAAIEMIELLPKINDFFREKDLPEFKVGIGLNSGECSVGNMGSDVIFSYTALGDNMNLGARLEGMCKFYGSQIVISEFTYERIDHSKIKCRKLDRVRVKGKLKPVEIYEVFHSTHPFMLDEQAYQDFENAYALYMNKSFEESYNIFKALNEKFPDDKASHRFMSMSEEFLKTPPPADWDGVYTFQEK